MYQPPDLFYPSLSLACRSTRVRPLHGYLTTCKATYVDELFTVEHSTSGKNSDKICDNFGN